MNPRTDIGNLQLYLLGDYELGVKGLLDRTEKRLGTVPRAQHRIELKALCKYTRAQLEAGIYDTDELLGTIERILRHQGTWCSHQLRPVPSFGKWDGDGNRVSGVRMCDHCKITVVSPIPQDAICVVCGEAAFRRGGPGNEGKPVEYCGRGCIGEMYRDRNPLSDDDLADRRRRRQELSQSKEIEHA